MSVQLVGVNFTYPGAGAGVFDINLEIQPGELVACIGASGSGKTTLLKMVAGFEFPDRGQVIIDGLDVTRLRPRERQLGVVFQNYALFPLMTATDNVAYPLKVRHVAREERQRRARETLERVGLAQFADRYPGTLSGGQQQRVALARALVFQPKALLLDEPLSALDAALRPLMRDEIRRLQREHGIAALHITHDQEEALSMADRVAVMEAGRLVQVATPTEIYDRPATRSIAAFVGQANLWDGLSVGGDGVELPLGLLKLPPHDLPEGTPVTVLVRPENVNVGPAPDGINEFPCRVTRDRFLGSLRRYDAEIRGGTVLGETSARAVIERIHIPPRNIQLIPAGPHDKPLEEKQP